MFGVFGGPIDPLEPGRRVTAPGGFTLIEVLVVVWITWNLASLLLPTLAKTKAKGQGIQCLARIPRWPPLRASCAKRLLILLMPLLLGLPIAAKAQFEYLATNGAVVIIRGCAAGAVTIPETFDGLPITSIGSDAFSGCTSLTRVAIPDSLTSIGAGAFVGCTSLTSVTIPNSVTHIGDGALFGCASLTNVTIPNSVTRIGGFDFSN
jgi:hypothetical protein